MLLTKALAFYIKLHMETPTSELKTFLVSIPADLEQSLREIAQREKRSRNAQVNWILETWVRQVAAESGSSPSETREATAGQSVA